MQCKRSPAPRPGHAAAVITISRYVLGLACLAVVLGSMALAAVELRHRFFPDWTGALAWLTEAMLGLTLLIAILELLGAVGLFRLVPILVVSVLTSLGVVTAVGRSADAHARVRSVSVRGLGDRPATKLIALLATAALLAEYAGPTLSSYDFGIRTLDSLSYHMPWAAWDAQTGHITPLRFTDVEGLAPFYPATSELLHGLGILLLGRDTLSPGLNLVWLGLALLAAYCVGRPRDLGAATLLGAAIALGTPMMVFSQAGSAANDIVGVFFLLAAFSLLLNSDYRREPVVLAALAAGFAIGTKLTMILPALVLTVGVILAAPARRHGATAIRWLVPFVLAGGFWYVRDLIAVGNPIPWVNVPLLATPAPGLQHDTGFSIAHYATDSHFWRSVVPHALLGGLGNWWQAIVAAAVVGPLLCLLPGAGRTLRMLALVALASLLAYMLTPETAAGPAGNPLGFAFNLRYGAPGLTLCLTVLPLAPPFDPRPMRTVVLAGLLAVLVETIAQGRLWPPAYVGGAAVVGGVFLIAALLVWVRPWAERLGPRPRMVWAPKHGAGPIPRRLGRRLAVATVVVVVVGAVGVGGYAGQRHYLRVRYAYQRGISSLAPVWNRFRNVRDARVGIVGTFGGFFSYPLYGLDDSNRVRYIAQRGPHGSFTPIRSCATWRAAVNAGGYRYVITTPSRDPWNPRVLGPSPEGRWTKSDPAARLIFSRRATGQPIDVFEITAPLDPARCR
jgi:hypothetical protein